MKGDMNMMLGTYNVNTTGQRSNVYVCNTEEAEYVWLNVVKVTRNTASARDEGEGRFISGTY
jgi:hypothetical protein